MNDFRCLEFSGPDARDFLHRLTTVNFKTLLPGSGTRGLLLNATSKVLASFFVLCLSEDKSGARFLFLMRERELASFLVEIEKLHFSEEILYRPVGAKLQFEVSAQGNIPAESIFSFTQSFPVLINMRCTFEVLDGQEVLVSGNGITAEQRVLNLWPWEGAEWSIGQNLALDVGFDSWIHHGKGCYPGQEIVEKSLSVGHPARALVQVGAKLEFREGLKLYADDREVGKITTFAAQSALAVVQWKYRQPGTEFKIFENEFLGEAKCLK